MVDQLKSQGRCKLLVNDWCSIQVSLQDRDQHPFQPIRPYQTLLLSQR